MLFLLSLAAQNPIEIYSYKEEPLDEPIFAGNPLYNSPHQLFE